MLKVKDEYIAQRYIQQILNRLKFELNMIPRPSIFRPFVRVLRLGRASQDLHKYLRSVISADGVLAISSAMEHRSTFRSWHYLLEAVDSDSRQKLATALIEGSANTNGSSISSTNETLEERPH